ncbi:MAG: hypothetical protein KDD63_06475 [Bacteroidetes bacterium]|nr:hypothetical protein [Bacteroidota bacterium]
MKKIIVLLPLILLFFLPVTHYASSPSDQKVKLRLNLKEGDVFQIHTQIDQDISQVLMGQPQNITQSIGVYYQFKVLEVKGKLYSVEVLYTRTSFDTDGLLGSVHYDSQENPEEIPPTAIGYAAMVGQTFNMVVNAKGEVKAISGLDQLLDHMLAVFSEKYPGSSSAMADRLKKQYGDKNMMATMQQMMAIYPNQKVGIGDQWEKRYIINTGFPLEVANTYKLAELTDGEAKIEVFSTIASDPTEPVDMNSFVFNYEVAGHQEGTLTLNTANGWTTESSVNQELSGEVTMNGESLPDPQTWPISMSTKNKLKSN